MSVFLILILVLLIYTVLYQIKKAKKRSVIESIISSLADMTIVLAIFVLCISELLSIFHLLTYYADVVVWLLALIILGVYLFYLDRKGKIALLNFASFNELHIFDLCSTAIIVFFIITFIGSLLSAPHCHDCMTYHMPRVVHWINDKTIYSPMYNTADVREIVSPILAELFVLHVYLLTGSDMFVNLIQWAAYLITAVMLYGSYTKLIKKEDDSIINPFFAALLFCTIPIALAETQTTQNDLCGTMWVMIFVYYAIDLFDTDEIILNTDQIMTIVKLGLLVGLAYICKSNACIAMVGFLLMLVIKCIINKEKPGRILKSIGIGGVAAIAIMSSSFVMIYYYWRTIIPSKYTDKIMIGTMDPKLIILNVYKNVAQIANNEWTAYSDEFIINVGKGIAGILGCDINDPAISFSSNFEQWIPVGYTCDNAPQNWLVIVTLGSVLAGLILLLSDVFRKKKEGCFANLFSNAQKYVIWSIAISSCATFSIIRWQPWVTRLLLPCTVTWTLLSALIINAIGIRYDKNKREYINLVQIIILWTGIFLTIKTLSINASSVKDGIDALISGNWEQALKVETWDGNTLEEYEELEKYLVENGCEKLGLYKAWENEYAMLTLLDEVRDIRHVVPMEIAKYNHIDVMENKGFIPDYILLDIDDWDEDKITYCQRSYIIDNYENCPKAWKLFKAE